MTALRAFFEALRTALSDIGRRPLFSLLSVAAMTAAILALAAFLVVSRGAREGFGRLADQAALEVFLRPGADPAAIQDLADALSRSPAVRRVEKVSSGQALAELTRVYPDLADVQDLLGENPLPASLRVTPQTPDPQAMAQLVQMARAHRAALSVRYDREWLESLARLGQALRASALAGALVLLMTALVTVGSVIRLALDDKLDEVALLRLVGAPLHFMIAPVLLGGAILGGAGAFLAVLLVGFGRTAVLGWASATPVAPLLGVVLGSPPPWGVALGLCLAGAAAGAGSAGLAARRAVFR